jgi:hypothetical protein
VSYLCHLSSSKNNNKVCELMDHLHVGPILHQACECVQKKVFSLLPAKLMQNQPLKWGSVTHQMAVPVPRIGCCVLNHHYLFYHIQNALAFNWDTCCHLALCLRLLPFHWTCKVALQFTYTSDFRGQFRIRLVHFFLIQFNFSFITWH